MAHKLFPSYGWSRPMPAPFDDGSIDPRTTDPENISKYNSMVSPRATLHPPTLRALMAYMDIDPTIGTPTPGSKGAVGRKGAERYVAEYHSHSEAIHAVAFNRNNGKFAAACVSESGSFTPYSLTEPKEDGAALILALLPLALQDDEFSELYTDLARQQKGGYPDFDKALNIAYKLCDNLYRRITNASSLGSSGISVDISTTNIPRITSLQVDKGEYSPSNVIAGEFTIFTVDRQKSTEFSMEHKDFVGKYSFTNRSFSVWEEKLLQTLSPAHELDEETVELCEHALKTTAQASPMRKFMLRGPSSVGKTEASRAVSVGLHLPYVVQTCSSDADLSSLIGSFVPDAGTSNCDLKDEELPSFADIRIDPATAFKKLTGEYLEGISEEEVYQKLIEVISERTATHYKEDGGIKYKYTETPFVQAMRNGWVVELQEISIILNQGVLVGLNGLLDQGGQLLLPTGEILHRHPDAVLIITTNTGYVGCRSANQSVLSRMDMVFDFKDLPPKKMIHRAAAITGFKDRAVLEAMAKTIGLIQAKCREEHISDGTCGTRQLVNWVESYQISKDTIKSARRTVIPFTSQDEATREDIEETCLNTVFAA